MNIYGTRHASFKTINFLYVFDPRPQQGGPRSSRIAKNGTSQDNHTSIDIAIGAVCCNGGNFLVVIHLMYSRFELPHII